MAEQTTRKPIGYALIGTGSFGRFCLEQYRQLDDLKLVAVADVNEASAIAAADRYQVDMVVNDLPSLLGRDDLDIVHIATPPGTHRMLSEQAMQAGKHVLCEKPLATTIDDAEAMAATARRLNRVLAANLIMRYDPLCHAVKRIMRERLLGEPLHGFFENYAKDEPLPQEHWFWDKQRSGGIFIEHSVHFFDLFASWLGEGEILAAQQTARPGVGLANDKPMIEQVQCTLRYADGVLVNFYHGFTQATRMDRKEMRLLCERGDIRLFEWTPLSLAIDCLADEATAARLADILPNSQVECVAPAQCQSRHVTSRGKRYDVDGRYRITANVGVDKPQLYGEMLRALMQDQIAAIRDPDHVRRVDESNGVASLRLAFDAEAMATAGG